LRVSGGQPSAGATIGGPGAALFVNMVSGPTTCVSFCAALIPADGAMFLTLSFTRIGAGSGAAYFLVSGWVAWALAASSV